jgi:hypothetical protein
VQITINDNEKGVQSDNRFDTPFSFIMDSFDTKKQTLKEQDEGVTGVDQ